MFLKSISIKNFRLFSDAGFSVDLLNIPDGKKEGSGLTVFAGENGCGKTTILDAISLSLLEYRGDSFTIEDFNNPREYCLIEAKAKDPFEVKKTMPKGSFKAKGFIFKAGLRDRRASTFLSSMIVSDLYYDSLDPENPKPNSPDLRVSVNNPFSGKRFSDNDFLVLDRNRLYQIKAGTFSSTRFDRLMEDLDYQYVKSTSNVPNINNAVFEIIKQAKPSNSFLKNALSKFKELTGIDSNLDFIDNYHPYKTASFVSRKDNNQQIKISSLGSGYEMIFTLIYSYYLSLQSNKQLIVIIDEPELHMHPKLQQKLLTFLLSVSKDSQVFISTHSPLLIKQLSTCSNVKIYILDNNKTLIPMSDRVLPYSSSNETNYLAFNLPSDEYHNELFGMIVSNGWLTDFESGKQKMKYIRQNKNGTKSEEERTLSHYIRDVMHHPENKNNSQYTYEMLSESIIEMRNYIEERNNPFDRNDIFE